MNREEILDTLRNIRNLPTLPDVVMEILRLCDDPNTSTRQIAQLIEKDPVLTTKVLKLVNSSYFGLSKELFSINQALVLIGYNNLKSMVMSASMLQVFNQDSRVGSFSRKALWKHSVGVGIGARFMARRFHIGDPEQIFVAGLIHDVGKVIIDWYFHSQFVQIIDLVDREHCWIREAENRVLQVTHEEIGSYLASRWNLPDMLKEGIAHHHQPSLSTEHAATAALIQLSDALIRELDVGYGGDPTIPQIDGEISAILPLTESPDDMMTDLAVEMEQSSDVFDLFN
jgi:HD-like signal output (HDOD) protein